MPSQPDQVDHRSHFSLGAEDSLQFLWAVSYTDLLMVLISFFVIFFQLTPSLAPTPVESVTLSLKNEFSTLKPTQPRPNFENADTNFDIRREITFSSVEDWDHANLKADPHGKKEMGVFHDRGIVIDFPDNFYRAGTYALGEAQKEELKKVLEAIKPHSDALVLTFIGHSDQSPMKAKQGAVIDSNLVLSNLRAAKAVEFAVTQGFNPRTVVSQGADMFSRNTRSLSLRLVERKP